jgi:outer membrane protein assembly factor BamE (lipoprotein component of BamABCDE complex)
MLLRTILVLCLGLAVVACSPRTAIRGNLLTDTQIAQIKAGETDRTAVNRLLGPPSTQGTFDSRVWYYIGRNEKKWAFFNPSVSEQKVVAIYFDEGGIVEHIERYNKDDAREVDVVDRETPTSGRSIGFFEQMFGNLGTFGGGSGGGEP